MTKTLKPTAKDAGSASTSLDGFLDNGFFAFQPAKGGHRSGLDALMLAATVPSDFIGTVADLGSGCGIAGMAVAHRCTASRVTLFEIDETSHKRAEQSLALPQNAGLADRVQCCLADVTYVGAAQGLSQNTFEHVIANPPYNGPSRQASTDAQRASAHVMDKDLLNRWSRTAVQIAKPKGKFSVILRPENLAEIQGAFDGRFGGICVLPLHSKLDEPATRLIVQGTKGAKAALKILPQFTIHQADGRFTEAAESVFRGKSSLAI